MAKVYLARDKKRLVLEAETASELILLQRAKDDGILKNVSDVIFSVEKK